MNPVSIVVAVVVVVGLVVAGVVAVVKVRRYVNAIAGMTWGVGGSPRKRDD